MKKALYARLEKAIAAGEAGSIRDRWLWGLRILRDPEVIASSGRSLRHGAADQLIAIAGKNHKGKNRLSEREIQWRLQCARAYPTETQIRNAVSDFDSWRDLVAAGFPPYDAPEGEPPADYRTANERDHDRARALLDRFGDQGTLFPVSDFEPVETTLKDLQAYAAQMRELTSRFAERDRKRQAYLDRMIEAAGGDLSMTWQEAHDRLGEGTEPGEVAA